MKILRNSKTGMIDELHITIRDKYGNIKKDYTVTKSFWYRLLKYLGIVHNSIVYKGMNATASMLANVATVPSPFEYMDIGTGTNSANNAQTALQTTQLSTRPKITATLVKTDSGSTDNETCQWIYTFSQANNAELTGTDTITEVGMFNHATTGVMLLRITWAGDSCNWDAGDTLQLTVKCQIKQGA